MAHTDPPYLRELLAVARAKRSHPREPWMSAARASLARAHTRYNNRVASPDEGTAYRPAGTRGAL